MIEHLVGLQAQVPSDPYTALWSRIDGFDPMVVSGAMEAHELVRLVVMRGTIHLVTAADALALRSHMQAILDDEMFVIHRDHRDHLRDLDLDPVLAFGRQLLTHAALTPAEIRAAMAVEFPGLDASSLAFACRNKLALVQVPPRGLWGRGGAVRTMATEGWLGAAPEPVTEAGARRIVERYLRAFGPASVRDIVAWSRIDALGEVMAQMAGELRPYLNHRGVELFDVPDGEIISADVDAPVRFLPEFDNVLLSHRDRSRFGEDARRSRLGVAVNVKGTVLIDGVVAAAWRIDREAGSLVVEYLDRRTKKVLAAMEREGRALLRFLRPDAPTSGARSPEVRLVPLD